ncbi:hypothetical protein PR048_031121 [Dryococelus australis]|uniref:Uncharacterized protein n=1 Tax=Dryococelus australis TaxID=614101 RepID=A0ABQ9G4C5_9NEOP|nr:hypothetical protein PR048_031121 [Dryococelus australis]
MKRGCRVNSKHLPEMCDSSQPSVYLQYVDAINLYGKAMSLPLPKCNFQWCDTDIIVMNVADDSNTGYIFEVDVEYLTSLNEYHKDLPFLPVNECPSGSKQKKPLTMLETKTRYVVHYRNFKQALAHGLKLPYIDLNTKKRRSARNDFGRDFVKLVNDSTFGKLMENKRKRQRAELLYDERRIKKAIAKTSFKDRMIYNESVVLVKPYREVILFDKPIHASFAVLDLSKTVM